MQALLRRYHHSILVPTLRLDARSLENVVIHPRDNDICLMAADICVSCFHFIEHAKLEEPSFGEVVGTFSKLPLLSDVANTRKHLRRHKAARQVDLKGRLAFEVLNDMFGFIQTEVIAIDSRGCVHDVHALLFAFIDHVSKIAGLGHSFDIRKPTPKYYLETCRTRLTNRTLWMSETDGILYRRNADQSYRPAEGGIKFVLDVVPDISEEETFGRFKLVTNMPDVLKWFVASDKTVEC